jgi:DNA-binding response OmpR family regulator
MTRIPAPTLVLIANDPQMSYLIERYGERSGCHVKSANTVDRAVALMRRNRPAMVLLHLTGWPHDGWPLLRALKEQSALGTIPITIISAIADEPGARAEGATYWLWQPVMYDDFQAPLVAAGVLPQLATLTHIGTGRDA